MQHSEKKNRRPEPAADLGERARHVAAVLAGRYPAPTPHLAFRSPWELLVAVMLSAQCTDAMVNKVTPALFARFPDPARTAEAPLEELEALVRSTGFFRTKANNLRETARIVAGRFNGVVPDAMKDLLLLPGVARKTAAVVLWGAFDKNEGVAVDTHVGRISFRLGLTQSTAQARIERDLMALFPRAEWGLVNHRMVSFGRDVCRAQRPLCPECPVAEVCPRLGVGGAKKKRIAPKQAGVEKMFAERLKKTTNQRKDGKEPPAASSRRDPTGGYEA